MPGFEIKNHCLGLEIIEDGLDNPLHSQSEMIVDQVSEPIMSITDEELAQVAQPSQRPHRTMAANEDHEMEQAEPSSRVQQGPDEMAYMTNSRMMNGQLI